uniref:Uncharacterized protein n=1 Tax=Rhizophora mucronata TaxID=61149 RepID=A0A2P2ISN3_RHIMU
MLKVAAGYQKLICAPIMSLQMPVCIVPSSGVHELLSMLTLSGMQCFQSNERCAFSQEFCISGQQDRMLVFNLPGSGTYFPCPTAMPAGTHAQDCRSVAAASGCYAGTVTPDIPPLSTLDPEVWKIDLKAVSSGTRKGTISETSCKFFISFCVHAAWVCLGDLSL